MRAVSRIRTVAGAAALFVALALASPGVRVTRADQGFSWDPALEPAAQRAARVPVAAEGATCAASQAPVVMPPLRSMPLPVVGEDGELNSLNGRGYNIGSSEPTLELQLLISEVKRRRGR
jgi:hypothetical protein